MSICQYCRDDKGSPVDVHKDTFVRLEKFHIDGPDAQSFPNKAESTAENRPMDFYLASHTDFFIAYSTPKG